MKGNLPKEVTKIVATTLSRSFRECTTIKTEAFPQTLKSAMSVVVKNKFVGINASDINFTAGTYKDSKPPFDCGFEALGEVVAVGSGVESISVGQPVVFQCYGAFATYQTVPCLSVRAVPELDKKYLPLEISGLTASIALDECAKPREGETALVTAAAGATGSFAVQLLKHVYKCKTVIGTCSTAEKASLLSSIGCDRVYCYKQVDLGAMLDKDFPHGVHVIYESVGGKLFDTCIERVAVKGRLVTLGSISGYKDGTMERSTSSEAKYSLPWHLLQRSASVHGFFLPHYRKVMTPHFEKLVKLVSKGTVRSVLDERRFVGLEQVADAVEYLHRGESTGKVIVEL